MKNYKNKLRNILFFLNANEMAEIFEAVDFAEKMHSGILRVDGEPYFNHLLRVAIATAEHFAKNDRLNAKTATISAILHDVVEDTEATIEEVREKFGAEVEGIVASLSHSANPDGTVNDDEPDEVYFERISNGGKIAILVKRYDVLDNILSLKNAPENFRNQKIEGHQARMHLLENMDPESAVLIKSALKKY